MNMIKTVRKAIEAWLEKKRAIFKIALSPPPKLSVSEWSDRYRYLSSEASAEPGKWRTDRAPYLRGIMDACSDPMIERVVFMKSAQVGSTEIILNILGYYIDQDPAPVLVLQPTLDMATSFSKDRVAPMLRDSPKLKGKVKDAKSRDSGNTLLQKTYPGGHTTMAGANSAASLASRPIRVVLYDEVDRYPLSAGSEGDPIELAAMRTSTFHNRKIFMGSTPVDKGTSAIEKAFLASDQRRYFIPCPHCNYLQHLVWSNIKWENADPETAHYKCEGCGEKIEEQDKYQMLVKGIWVPQNPGSKVAGFHINALYSPWLRWTEVVTKFLNAKGNPETLKVFINTILGETWEEDGERVEADTLASRREKYLAEVPMGVGILTAGVDVQGDRLELKVKGWGVGQESWLIAHRQIFGDPGKKEVWDELDKYLTQSWKHESGATLQIMATAIDSGGHHTQNVYEFTRIRNLRKVWAIKGHNHPGRPIWGRPGRQNKHGAKLVPIGTDTAKDIIFTRMKAKVSGPGYMHLPNWADEEYLAQLTAEKVITKFVKGRPFRAYEKIRPRNEALDLEVYALAALYSLGPAVMDSLANYVVKVMDKAEKIEEESKPKQEQVNPFKGIMRQQQTGRGSGFINGWK